MRKLLFALAAILTIAVVPAPPSEAAGSSCAVVWGSLAKSSSVTGTGQPVAIRTGRHTCYDRLVIDLNGPASGYRVEYVSELIHDGSGAVVPVKGGAIIKVVVNAAAHDESGNATIDINAVNNRNVSSYKTFRDTEWAGSFEGRTTFGLGVRARLPFRVFTLAGPGAGSRLVIDVAHRW